jgi:hypothetical protein
LVSRPKGTKPTELFENRVLSSLQDPERGKATRRCRRTRNDKKFFGKETTLKVEKQMGYITETYLRKTRCDDVIWI